MKIYTTFLMLLISLLASANDKSKIDSLQNSLKFNITNEQFAKTYLALSSEYIDENADTCRFYANKVIDVARKGNLGIQVALAYQMIGKSYDRFNNETEALENYMLALNEGEKHNNGVAMILCALCYFDIGDKYNTRNEHTNALEYRRKAWNLIQLVQTNPVWAKEAEEYDNEFKDPAYWNLIKGAICGGLGTTYLSLSELDSSIYYYEKALMLFQESTYKEASMIIMLNVGNVYMQKKQYPQALSNYKTAMEFGVNNDDPMLIAQTGTNMATIYNEQGQYKQAIDILSKAISGIRRSNIPSTIARYYALSAKSWEGQKNFEKASAYKDSLILIKDSLYESTNIEKNAELKVKFETLEKEKQIQLLKKEKELTLLEAESSRLIQNALIASIIFVLILLAVTGLYLSKRHKALQLTREKETMSAKIEGQDVERQRIAADLHDRLGSMLATVKLYFTGMEASIEQLRLDTKDQYLKATELLDDACAEVRKISHDLSSDLLANQGLVAALHNLKETLINSRQLNMQVLSHGIKERLHPVIEVTLYRIIQELTSNVIKHSKAENLTVQLTMQVNALNLVIEDDGVGFDSTDINYQAGLGLRTLSERVNKLKGKFHIDSREGKGTTVIIDIPI